MKKLVFLLLLSMGAFYLNAQNNCLTFDGSDDYVSTGYTTQLDTWTIECWVKGDNAPTTGNISTVVYRDANFQINWNHSQENFKGTVALRVGETTWYPASFGTLEAGIWYHLAGTYDGSELKAYKNGVLITTNSSPNGYTAATNQSMLIGNNFDGQIDEVRIWNVVRTETEIRQNMYRELPDPDSELTLVAYYKLNESGSTTSAEDSKGSNDGTLINYGSQIGYWQTSPAFFGPKNCLDFDGTNDYISVPENDELKFGTGNFTIEFWTYLDNLSARRDFITRKKNSEDLSFFVDNSKVTLYTYNGQVHQVQSTTDISSGQWVHIAGVRDGDSLLIYINGIKDGSQKGTVQDFANNSPLEIGCNNNASFLLGKMDEVRIWNTARTETEIQENMCTSLTGNEANLVAYYNFDNKTGDKLQDFSGNGNDGTLTNMTDDDWVASAAFNTWLNTSSTVWSLAGNWSRGSVPTSTDHVGVHEQDGDDPDISSDIECHNLTIGLDATLDFQSGSHTIHGSVFNIGTTNINNGTNLTVTGSVYMLHHSHINIKPLAELTIDKDLHTEIWGLEGYLTIESDNNGTGSLIVGGSSSGKLTTQRYITDTKWHYVSAPVSGQAITND